ncbi:Ribosomal large subunit pseudouridine synthase D [Anaerobiospirillum thomasii]|uniref:23S rRNA pseudouridine(1911/1915/1917) synthase RluD n=1 Tax=Anaerobiospirillum thomasii TaxID=179995 RepID=UPI000D9982B9|nr:23S rRNA pseudouridine(1911/1915/1917) synthase RluD [Anaerobiospirillum thomasii]SPT68630.1 Ribosomal large subunit pseudouridine synthase D [Anaerobiospirillum thomasii]
MSEKLDFIITDDLHSSRLDQALGSLVDTHSRSVLKGYIEEGLVSVDGQVVTKPSFKLVMGQRLELTLKEPESLEVVAQNLPLDIVYSDEHLIVINKPINFVVHPGAGVKDGTVMNAVLYHFPQTKILPRAGIVHRLDKDTSGLMVIALTQKAQQALVKAISKHDVVREYEAVAEGLIASGGTVDAAIGRDVHNRTRMAIMPDGIGREAVTHYRVMECYRAHSRIRLRLDTGRTHQIRVHMASIGHPLLGDNVYGGRRIRHLSKASDELQQCLHDFRHQALHAVHIEFVHPVTDELLSFDCPLPDDMQHLISLLKEDAAQHV